jgi:hypothetical protein
MIDSATIVCKQEKYVSDSVPIKDMGQLEYFLGIEAAYNSGGHAIDTKQVCF